jgi:RND family efflux transporter MFP subunit
VGDPASISLWADSTRIFLGRVREIAGGADPATRTYTVRITALDPPSAAQLGMTATVALRSATAESSVLLPVTALADARSEPAVWIVDPKTSRVQLRKVGIGELLEDGIVIRSGLQPGDRVVTAGVQKLRPDQQVRVGPAPSPAIPKAKG